MRSGTKNIPVDIYQFVRTGVKDSMGKEIVDEVIWRSPWASVAPRRGRELVNDGQIIAEQYTRFDFDYFDVEGITEQMFLVCEGVRYDIKGLLPDTNVKEYFTVDCVAQGRRTGT